ncbi:MAG: M56 family metallopeptidase, partial [Ginsengibacter sp.]
MNFTAFQHSAFLQSLGWAIANNIWQAGICWALYYFVVSSYTSASSKFKNNVSTLFLFSTFLWFIITFLNKFIHLQNNVPEATPRQLIFSADFYSVSRGISFHNFIHTIGITLPYLSVGYLLLLLIFTVKLINSYLNTVFIKYNGLERPGVEWRLFVEKVAGHMNITKRIKLWFSNHVDVPATIGFLKPVILIPVASLNQLTSDQLEAIILHELSHIKRNDYFINLFISLIETVLFFNPFIVLLSKVIKKERENCCDDFVLQYQYDRHSYASALLSLEKYRIQNLHLALTATSGKKQLLFRIKRIMEVKSSDDSLNYGQKLLALLLVTGIICSIAWLSPAKRSNQSYNSKQIHDKNFAAISPEIAKEKNISLRLKNETTVNFIVPTKIIKSKPITLINISEKNNFPKKKAGAIFKWKLKDDDIENNPRFFDAYNNSAVNAQNMHNAPAEFTGTDNYFLPKFSFTDLNFLQNFNFYINKLGNEIENNNHSFSLINWNNVKQEVFESLEKIKIAPIKINTEKIQIIIEKLEKDKEKNIQKEFQFSFLSDNTDNIPTWSIYSRSRDSLFTKGINSSNNDRDRILIDGSKFPTPAVQPQRRNRTIKIFPQVLNHPPIYSNEDKILTNVYLTDKEKLPLKQALHINYKNGAVIINGKKIHLSELKKYQAQAMVEKLLRNCNKQIVEIE